MSHPKDSELIPIGTPCIWTRPSHRVKPKIVKAKIVKHCYRFPSSEFANYEVEIEGQPGKNYAAFHHDLEITSQPPLS